MNKRSTKVPEEDEPLEDYLAIFQSAIEHLNTLDDDDVDPTVESFIMGTLSDDELVGIIGAELVDYEPRKPKLNKPKRIPAPALPKRRALKVQGSGRQQKQQAL